MHQLGSFKEGSCFPGLGTTGQSGRRFANIFDNDEGVFIEGNEGIMAVINFQMISFVF